MAKIDSKEVLIVEHSEFLASSMRCLLEMKLPDTRVVICETLDSANEYLKCRVPDVISSDMRFPKKEVGGVIVDAAGLILMRQVCADPRFEKTILMLLSSWDRQVLAEIAPKRVLIRIKNPQYRALEWVDDVTGQLKKLS